MQRARDLWWIVLFVVVLGGASFFRGGLSQGGDTSGAPKGVLQLPDCYDSMDEAYSGPFSSRDCWLYYTRGDVIHLRYSPPTGDELEGEIAVDYYARGNRKPDILREQHLTAYDYPLFVRNSRFWFVPVSRAHRAQIAVWRWDPRNTDRMMHIGDLPYGAVANVYEDYFAVTQDSAPGPWRATLFHVRDNIERIGTFTVTGDRFEDCRVSAVAEAITVAGLSADQLKICDVLHANDQGPRAYRDEVPVEPER
jgi:hypothetical protein